MEIFKLFGEVTLKDNITTELKKIENESKRTSKSIEEIEDSAKETGKESISIFSKMGETIGNITSKALIVGGAIGALVGIGTAGAMNISGAFSKLQNTTTATDEEMSKLKQTMLDIYTSGFGDSLDDVAETMSKVKQIGVEGTEQIYSMTTGALLLKSTLGIETSESIRASKMMMDQFKLSGDEAYGLISLGAKNGLDKNEDLLDSINEYSPQFAQMGFNGEQMFQLLKNGMDSGAFSIDKIGDAIKEFNIRAKDGSKGTIEAYTTLGLEADKTGKAFAQGGEASKSMFDTVITKISEMKDPMEQNTVGVALFGTMWEDLGSKVVLNLNNSKTSLGDFRQEMFKLESTKLDSLGTGFEMLKRQIEVNLFLPFQEKVLPVFKRFLDWINQNQPTINAVMGKMTDLILAGLKKLYDFFEAQILPSLRNFAKWFIDNRKTIEEFASKSLKLLTDAFKLLKDKSDIIISVLAGVLASMIALNIVNTVTAGISALTIAVGAAKTAWLAYKAANEGATIAQWLLNAAMSANPIGIVIAAIGVLVAAGVYLWQNWDTVKAKAIALWSTIKTTIGDGINWLVGVWGNLAGQAMAWGSNIIDGIINGVTSKVASLKNVVSNVANGVKSAFTGLLGIKSPSTVFAEYGLNIVEGLAKGVQENQGLAEDALAQISTDIMDMTEKSIDDKIRLLDQQTEEQKRIYAQQEYDEKYASLQKNISKAKTNDERKQAEKDLNDFIVDNERKAQEESISNQKEYLNEIKRAIKEKEEAEKKYIEDFKDQMTDMGNNIITALKNRYEKERDLEEKRIDESISALKKQSSEKMQLLKSDYELSIMYLDNATKNRLSEKQSQIDAIEALTKEEEAAIKEKNNRDRLDKMHKEMIEEKDFKKQLEMKQEIDAALAEIERERLLEERQKQIEALQTQMQNIQDEAELQREKYDSQYQMKQRQEEKLLELSIQKAEENKKQRNDYWTSMLEEENLMYEANYMLVNNKQEDIINLLDSYNPSWKEQGKSFGERLMEGLTSMEGPIKNKIADLLEQVNRIAALSNQATNSSAAQKLQGVTSNALKSTALPSNAVNLGTQTTNARVSQLTVNVTGNTIMGNKDADRMGSVIVNRLNSLGVNSL